MSINRFAARMGTGLCVTFLLVAGLKVTAFAGGHPNPNLHGRRLQHESDNAKTSKSSPVNVTSTVFDFVTGDSGTPNLTRSDNSGAGQASYTTENGVISQIFGFWELGLEGQSARTVFVTLSQPANGSKPSPIPDGSYSAEVISRCFDASNNIVNLETIAPGTTNNLCSFRVNLVYENTTYAFVMSPDPADTANAKTGSASVTCSTTSGTTCNSWTIVPYVPCTVGSAGCNATVAALYSTARNGKQTLIGTYFNTYRVLATNP
jgi:hypothetical protein